MKTEAEAMDEWRRKLEVVWQSRAKAVAALEQAAQDEQAVLFSLVEVYRARRDRRAENFTYARIRYLRRSRIGRFVDAALDTSWRKVVLGF